MHQASSKAAFGRRLAKMIIFTASASYRKNFSGISGRPASNFYFFVMFFS